jgi:hypothetical protein
MVVPLLHDATSFSGVHVVPRPRPKPEVRLPKRGVLEAMEDRGLMGRNWEVWKSVGILVS